MGGSRSKTEPIRAFHHFSFPSFTTFPAFIAHRFRKDAENKTAIQRTNNARPILVSFHSSSHNCQGTSETYQCPEQIALSQDRFFTSNESPQSHQLRFSSVPPISAWLVKTYVAIILAHQKAENSCCATSLPSPHARENGQENKHACGTFTQSQIT